MKIILGIESSCDETAAAILQKDNECIKILSNIVSSSANLQAKYGGIIPEQAAREQVKAIIPVLKEAFKQAKISWEKIDAIAVTQGPGLIGSLLVGVETAKVLALVQRKKLIAVNHLLAHFYANWVCLKDHFLRDEQHNFPSFPFVGLLVSGGHTDLLLFKNHHNYLHLGSTRDDAAGECLDKSARLLGLGYPGGPIIAKLASKGDPQAIPLPRPMIESDTFDFSFSGLKTAVANLIKSKYASINQIPEEELANICASLQEAVVDSLIGKTLKAATAYHVKQIVLAGGVSANQRLREKLAQHFSGQIYVPPPFLCTDNAAMVAACAFYHPQWLNPITLEPLPELAF